MYNNWNVDMAKTQEYIEILKQKIFKGVDFYNLEQKKDELILWLDKYAGIDYVFKTKLSNQIVGVAARIQYNKNWQTFTIRHTRHTGAKTEYEKRLEAIEKGYFYPTFTLQAYFDEITKVFLGAAIIETKVLYDFIQQNQDKIYFNKSDNLFIVVKWNLLKDYNIKIFH